MTGPGSANVIGGQFVAMKTFGDSVEGMTLRFPVAMKAAFGENPKRCYGSRDKTPETRMATAAILRKALTDAQEYQRKLEKGNKDADKTPDRDLGKEMLVKVLRRELPLKVHAHRADDILTAIRICKEFNLRFTLDHCTEGYMIPKFIKGAIAEQGAGVIIGPLLSERSKIELRNLTFEAPRILYENGIEFAMMTDSPVIPQQYLPICAALAVREGLPNRGAALHHISAANFASTTAWAARGEQDADVAVPTPIQLDFRALRARSWTASRA